MKHYRCLYDHNDQNYKNSVYVDKAWQNVSKDFGENVTDCKKKWRHLRSSLSRYLKSSKDIVKNKNNKLKPYYLLQHMDFLVPYTKTLEMKTENIKFEANDEHEGFSGEMKSERVDGSSYDQEIIQEESQSMEEEEENVVYEAYEIQDLPSSSAAVASTPNQKSQITLVRSSHGNNQQNTNIPQLQPLMNHPMTGSTKPQGLHAQISQQSPPGQNNMQSQNQGPMSLQNTLIPLTDEQSSADLNFFLALLPDVRHMNQEQKRRLRIGTLKLIDEILGTSH